MNSNAGHHRLLALDGVRGLAVMLVVLVHMGISAKTVPIHPIVYRMLFVSGDIGVGLFFVLSGFLMAYLYPFPADAAEFLQKRYARIFPLFLTACVAQMLFRLAPLNGLLQLLIFCSLAIMVYVMWVYGIKRTTKSFKRTMWIAFFSLQVVVGLSYFLISQNVVVFDLSKIPETYKLLLTGLVNGTLTFFAGNAFPRLDAVYWSLAAEVIFYMLYPIVCAPVIAHLSTKSRYIKVLFLLTTVPLFLGVSRLFERSPDALNIRVDFFFNFVGGMTLGYLFRKYGAKWSDIKSPLRRIPIDGIVGVVVICILVYVYNPQATRFVPKILLTVAYTLVIWLSLLPKTAFARIVNGKSLVYLGTVSYSLYLSHMWTIGVIRKILGQPMMFAQVVPFIIVTVIACVLFASVLYWLLERPYFIKHSVRQTINKNGSYVAGNKWWIACVSICVIYLISAVFFAYRTNLTYENLTKPYYTRLVTAANLSQKEARFVANERIKVGAEKSKTLIMIIPFLLATCYLIYQSRLRYSTDRAAPMVVGRVTGSLRQKKQTNRVT